MLPSRNGPRSLFSDLVPNVLRQVLSHICADGFGRERDRRHRTRMSIDELFLPAIPSSEQLGRRCCAYQTRVRHTCEAHTRDMTRSSIDACCRDMNMIRFRGCQSANAARNPPWISQIALAALLLNSLAVYTSAINLYLKKVECHHRTILHHSRVRRCPTALREINTHSGHESWTNSVTPRHLLKRSHCCDSQQDSSLCYTLTTYHPEYRRRDSHRAPRRRRQWDQRGYGSWSSRRF